MHQILKCWIELYQVLPGHQLIDVLLILRQATEIHTPRGWYNGMMRTDLFIVPYFPTDTQISTGCCRFQIRAGICNSCNHLRPLIEMARGQIAAIRTRISDQFMALIELLTDIECLLRIQVKAFGSIDLQRRQVIGQWRFLLFLSLLTAFTHPCLPCTFC